MKNLISAEVLAEALDLTEKTIRRYTQEGRIPYTCIGDGEYRYDLDEVVATLTKGGSEG